MEQLKALKDYLMQFPQWGSRSLTVDIREGKPESCALFPKGIRVLDRREDVQGHVKLRLRQSFLLRAAAFAGESAASRMMAFQNWLLTQPTQTLEPYFGSGLWLRAEAGQLKNGKQPGTGIYEVMIHAEYEKE